MKIFLLMYHNNHEGLDVQAVLTSPEAAQEKFPIHAKKWGMGLKEATQYFSIEVWDTNTGEYLEDIPLVLPS